MFIICKYRFDIYKESGRVWSTLARLLSVFYIVSLEEAPAHGEPGHYYGYHAH